jgi:hypothetical protein
MEEYYWLDPDGILLHHTTAASYEEAHSIFATNHPTEYDNTLCNNIGEILAVSDWQSRIALDTIEDYALDW